MANKSFGPAGEVVGDPVSLIPAGTTHTASSSGPAQATPSYVTVRLTLDVAAVAGTTPSMTVNVQTSDDGATWTTLGSFPAVTAAGKVRRAFAGLDRYVRATTTITGTTPSFTFGLSGEALPAS